MMFNLYKKGEEGGKGFSHPERGVGATSYNLVLKQKLEVLAIPKWGVKKYPLKGVGREKFYPVFRGAQKVRTHNFPIL